MKAGLCRHNSFSCWLHVTKTKNSDIVPFRHDVWAYHVTCVPNFLWCIACPRRPDTKLLGDPVWCMVASTSTTVIFICENRYPSTQTRELYPKMLLSSNQIWALCFPIALHQCYREMNYDEYVRERERKESQGGNLIGICICIVISAGHAIFHDFCW